MKVKAFLFACARLCDHLGYDAFLPVPGDKEHCACVDLVDKDSAITPFTLQWARGFRPPPEAYDDRVKRSYEDAF